MEEINLMWMIMNSCVYNYFGWCVYYGDYCEKYLICNGKEWNNEDDDNEKTT